MRRLRAALRWDVPRRCWRCPDCRQTYDRAALTDLLAEHVADGVRAGNTAVTVSAAPGRFTKARLAPPPC